MVATGIDGISTSCLTCWQLICHKVLLLLLLLLLPPQTQELPSLLIPLYLAASHPAKLQLRLDPSTFTAAAFLLHYTNRSLIYPLRLRGGKRTALTVWAMAALFCSVNGFLQVSQCTPVSAQLQPQCAQSRISICGVWLDKQYAAAWPRCSAASTASCR
jgi:hypothetical protein